MRVFLKSENALMVIEDRLFGELVIMLTLEVCDGNNTLETIW